MLNLFLSYQLWRAAYGTRYAVSSPEAVTEALAELDRRGIVVEATVPRRAGAMPFLLVGLQPVPAERVEALLALLPGARQETGAGWTKYRSGTAELTVYKDGRIVFRRPLPQADSTIAWGPSWARRVAEDFLTAHGGLPANAEPDLVVFDQEQGHYRVEYRQQYQGWPVFASRVQVLVTAGGVTGYETTWLWPLGYQGQRKPVIPATEALLQLVRHVESSTATRVLRDIDLGYFTRPYDAEAWEAVPAWRLRFDDGRAFVINAYTGELETVLP